MKIVLVIALSILLSGCVERRDDSTKIQISNDLKLLETTLIMLCSKRVLAYSEMKVEESRGRLNEYVTKAALKHGLKKYLRIGKSSSNEDVVVDPYGSPYVMKLEKHPNGVEGSVFHESWLVASTFDEKGMETRMKRIKLSFR